MDEGAIVEGTELIAPLRIETGALVRGGRIGPNVTLEEGVVVEDCYLEHPVVGSGAALKNSRLKHSIVGRQASVTSIDGSISVTDHTVISGST